MRENKTVTDFAKKIALDYSPSIDDKLEELQGVVSDSKRQATRALFSAESEEKILKHIK